LERHAERVGIETLRSYEHRLRLHILPAIGGLPLAEIRRSDLEGFLTTLERGKLAPRSQRKAWSVALDVIRDACVDFGLPDPSQRLGGPRAQPEPAGRALSREELTALTNAALGLAFGASAYVLVLAYTGLRRSEAACLRREDLDLASLDDAWLTVSRSKTRAGKGRRVPVPRPCAEALERHLATAPASPWVWPSKTDRAHHMNAGTGYRWIEAAGRAAGLEATPHDLRRTLSTLANRAGVDRLALQAILGHVGHATTDIYIRTSDEDRRKVLRVLGSS
jgi:integrase